MSDQVSRLRFLAGEPVSEFQVEAELRRMAERAVRSRNIQRHLQMCVEKILQEKGLPLRYMLSASSAEALIRVGLDPKALPGYYPVYIKEGLKRSVLVYQHKGKQRRMNI